MKLFVVMSGGFHPFHAGHASLYQQAKEQFPNATVLVCATNVQTERPFPFLLKKKLAQLSGVPPKDFIEVSRQFSAEDPALHQRIGDLNDAIVIFVRSDKDKNEQPQGLKLNPAVNQIPLVTRGPNKGKPQKLLDYEVNKDNLLPASQHTYMAYLKTVEFGPGITSASEIRKLWPTLNDKRKLAMVMSLYPATQKNAKLAQNVVGMFDQVMGQNVTEAGMDKEYRSHGEYEYELQQKANKALEYLQEVNPELFSRYGDEFLNNLSDKIAVSNPMASVMQIAGAIMRQATEVRESKSKVIAKTAKDLTNPPKIMQHRAKRDQEREEQLKYRDIAKRTDEKKETKDELFIQADPESEKLLRYAQQHYPTAPTKQQAFVKFVQRALKHSEEEDKEQDQEIQQIKGVLNKIQQDHQKIMKVSESQDYLDEK